MHQQWPHKRQRLATTSLGNANDVSAHKNRWQGLGLDGGWLVKAHFGYCCKQLGVKSCMQVWRGEGGICWGRRVRWWCTSFGKGADGLGYIRAMDLHLQVSSQGLQLWQDRDKAKPSIERTGNREHTRTYIKPGEGGDIWVLRVELLAKGWVADSSVVDRLQWLDFCLFDNHVAFCIVGQLGCLSRKLGQQQ